MTKVEFHILDSTEANSSMTDPAYLNLIGRSIQNMYRKSRKIYVHAADQEQAQAIDEWLWTQDLTDFIPHNLVGEGPNKPPPVQIGFTEPPENQHDCLINLTSQVPDFFSYFLTCLEIVPNQEAAKSQARERYKFFRSHGYSLQHFKH